MRWLAALLVALLVAVAPAHAQRAPVSATDSAMRGLVAQYEAALIRDRRLASDREFRLIADYEGQVRDLRARIERGEAAAEAQLREARLQLANYVAPIAARDGEARQLVEGYQVQLERDLSRASPEQLGALQRFADGDLRAGFAEFQVQSARRAAEREQQARAADRAARAANAADARQLASLGETMRLRGAMRMAEVIPLYESAVALDPSVAGPWLALVRLYRDSGNTENSLRAFEQGMTANPSAMERAQLQTEVGQTFIQTGQLPEARGAFQSSLDIAETMLRADANDQTAQQMLAVNLNYLGDVLKREGDLSAAQANVTRSITIVRQLLSSQPAAPAFRQDLAAGLRSLAIIQLAQQDFAGALASQTEALAISRAMNADRPTDISIMFDLSYALDTTGDIQRASGDLAGAAASYRESVHWLEQRVANNSNARLWYDVGLAYGKLATVQVEQQQRDLASVSYRDSLTILHCVAMRDQNNAEWRQSMWQAIGRIEQLPEMHAAWERLVIVMANLDRRSLLTPVERERFEAASARRNSRQQSTSEESSYIWLCPPGSN